MKHTYKTALTAAMLTAAVSMASAAALTSCHPSMVYGPPDYEYEPSSEDIQEEYGPPVAYEDETEETSAETSLNTDTATGAVGMQVVYGPPNAD